MTGRPRDPHESPLIPTLYPFEGARGSKFSGVLLWCALGLGGLGFGPPVLGSGDPFEVGIGSTELAALSTVPPLPAQARASILVDGATGHALLSDNADARLAPASLTKMMTALVALERTELSRLMVATEHSLSEPIVIGLDPGDALSLEEMLYGMLLPSGNDAALAIAETVGRGSIEQFVGWMNERTGRMGLRNTRFANPTGLDAPGQYSSARDMAEIARALLGEPTLARIVGTARYVAPGPPLYLFVNNNPLLGSYEGLDGVKTGFTDAAGRTFAASATRNGQRLILVVLNSPDIRSEGGQLLDLGFARARPVPLEVPRVGFARVREGDGLSGPMPRVLLVGWELPFLRAFTLRTGDTVQTSVSLAGRPLVSWSG